MISHVREKMIFEVPPTFQVLPDNWVGMLTPTSTTPSVLNLTVFKAVNTGAVTVTNFMGGAEAQRIAILGDGFTTVAHGTYIKTNTAANKLLAANKVYRFTMIDNVWYEDA